MNINFELYRIFYEVANLGNITKAAHALSISQPAISKSIKNLEEQLGGELFVRTKRGVVLTEEGKELYKYIKHAIEYIRNGENRFSDLANLETGKIRIGISTTLTKEFLLPYLGEFHKLYPAIDINIITTIASDLIPKLRNGLLDLVILNLPCPNYNDIEVTECKQVQDCFIVGSKYAHLAKKTISLQDLNNYPLLLQEKGSNTRTFIDNFCDEHKISLKANISLASYTLVVEFTKIGLGIGYGTKEYIQEELNTGELFELKTTPKIPPRYVGLALSKNHLPSFSAKKLIELIKKPN